ncbi:Na+/H+ antiporter subunit C [Lamprobacter modestohalophilus]|uniref:Na+/H+ antiporter subunit C n=1 Tax=Lamprobacter modestohalophilus TaxID=1064514 RepID=UPI0031B82045
MLWLFAASIGLLMGTGTYLVLRAHGFSVVLGLMLLTYATNLFVFASGGLQVGRAPVQVPVQVPVQPPAKPGGNAIELMADPLPQALVLTAIVIGFAMTALVLVLVLRALSDLGSERVDAQPMGTAPSEPRAGEAPSDQDQPDASRLDECQSDECRPDEFRPGKSQLRKSQPDESQPGGEEQ